MDTNSQSKDTVSKQDKLRELYDKKVRLETERQYLHQYTIPMTMKLIGDKIKELHYEIVKLHEELIKGEQ